MEADLGQLHHPLQQSISDTRGEVEFLEESRTIGTKSAALVDNVWAAPAPTVAGPLVELLLDPMIDVSGPPFLRYQAKHRGLGQYDFLGSAVAIRK